MAKKTGLILFTLIVAACVCLTTAGILGAGLLVWSNGSTSLPILPQATPTRISVSTANPTARPAVLTPTPLTGMPTRVFTPGVTPTPTSSTSNLTPAISAQMDSIQQQVVQVRSLKPSQNFQRGLLTDEQLRKKVLEDFFVDYSRQDARDDSLVLSMFGLLAPGFDLYQLYVDLYSEQVAGYYDSKTKEMYVVLGKNFGGTERSTYAHEYNHALQDQNFDMRDGLKIKQDHCKDNSEYCAAVQALIEGDSVLTEQLWVSKYATAQDKKDIQEFQRSYKSPVYDSAPAFLKEDFLFPYSQGFEFVMSLYNRGGFGEVDKAYRNPPVSTSQIMHPGKYPGSRPGQVIIPDLKTILGPGWTELDRNTLGEWYTYLVLARGNNSRSRLSDKNASQAAEGWSGDQYVIYTHSTSKPVLFHLTRWDKASDVNEYAGAFGQYGQLRWGKSPTKQGSRQVWEGTPDGMVVFSQIGADTLWLIAPDKAAAEQLLGVLKGF